MERREIKINFLFTIVLIIAISFISFLLVLEIQPGDFETIWNTNLKIRELLWLNYLPMLATILIFYLLLGNVFYSGAITVLIWGILSIINLLKTQGRGDPFVPIDLFLFKEGFEAAGNYDLQINEEYVFLIFGLSIILFLLGLFLKSVKPWKLVRLFLLILICVVSSKGVLGVYTDEEFYNNLPGPNRANVPLVYEAFGFPYMFLHNFNLNAVEIPENYDKAEAQGYEEKYLDKKAEPEQAPNVIMIMCEAFTDLPNEEVFSYNKENNPVALYNELAAQKDTISGHIIVSNTGAGTANTEFDVLTGMMTNKIGDGISSAFRMVRKNTDGIPYAFSECGYETFFIHPGNSWMYNRESVYQRLGISDQLFLDDFKEKEHKGGWVCDASFLKELKARLEERETPLFTYGVTAQNHQAYTEEKYGFLPETVPAKAELSEEANINLSVYFEGLRDSSKMLKDLTVYLEQQEEPYLLVFFGDHQPAMGMNYLTYRELGLYPEDETEPEQYLSLYSTPFLIWGNSAYQKNHNMEEMAQNLQIGEDYVMSSHYLGALTYRMAGFSGIDGYMDYLNGLRLELPVHSIYGSRLADGTWATELPSSIQTKEDIRLNWQYYKLKHEKIEDVN